MFAYPVNVFKPGRDKHELLLNVDKDRLKKAPGFESNRWPDFTKDSYRSEVDRFFFKADTAKKTKGGGRMMRASDLIGKSVNDRAQHGAGKIEDIVVNFSNGRARYVVLNSDKAADSNKKLLVVPFTAFIFPTRPDLNIMLNVPDATLAKAPAFQKDKWPDLNAPVYRQQTESYLASFRTQGSLSTNSSTEHRQSSGASQ